MSTIVHGTGFMSSSACAWHCCPTSLESRADAREQSVGLAEALRGAGGTAEVVAAPGETHMTINRDFGLAGNPEGERAVRFILSGSL